MQQKSLGLIETQGLAAGIEAADAAVKSANVELVGCELTKRRRLDYHQDPGRYWAR